MVVKMSTGKIESVADFYAGKSVFISGGTGFLGKAIIEKLLYNCPQIEQIFVLVREKQGTTSEQRIKQLIENQIFTRLKSKRPEDTKKIVPISGDIAARNLGLKPEDQKMLEEKVAIVIHSAATIRFNEPLSEAWNINVEGTRRMLELSRRMRNLEVFIHLSTAYTNSDREIIDEVMYPAPAAFSDVFAAVKKGVTAKETEEILNSRPNTYAFTKALTEHMVADNHGIIPIVIVRPSIVTAAKEEPMKGWLENWYGCTGLSTATAKGWNRITYGEENNIIDLVPVDYVTNLVVVAGARRDKYESSKDAVVYNCCSSNCNPITLGRIMGLFRKEALKYDSSIISIPLMFSTSEWVVWLVTLLLQILPAYIADFWRRLTGRRPQYVKLQSIVIQNRTALAYFTSHSWIMRSAATRGVHADLSPSDKEVFPCDPTNIDWDEYMKDYYWGVRNFLEKKCDAANER